jgi:outer membrane protein assembly factor BamB
VLLVLAGAGLAALYWTPSPTLGRGLRFELSALIVILTVLLLTVWLVFLSGLGWLARAAILALEVAVAVLVYLFVQVDFDGDVIPVGVHLRGRGPGLGLGGQAARALEPAEFAIGNNDYPEYRNRLRDGVAHGPPLVRAPAADHHPLWRKPVGGGYSGFAAAGKALITLEQRGVNEAVVCYDAPTGEQVWAHSYAASFQETLGGDGPRATPTLRGDRVYSLGATGKLVCLRARDGELVWQADVLADNANIHWGMSGSPLVMGDLVIVNPGRQQDSAAARAVLAYDRQTGKEVWHAGDHPGGYASPMRARLAGQEQVVIFDADGLAGYDADGKGELWRYDKPSYNGINVAQPLVLDQDRLFVSSGYGKGCALVRVQKQGQRWSVEELWKTHALQCKFTSPVLYKDHIYGLDEGTLACVDAATGERAWRGKRYGHGQLLRQDDLLVILSEEGEVALVEASPKAFRELGRRAALRGDKTWNCPALANGLLYVRNSQEMACFDLRAPTEGTSTDKR